jgi:hypothetical protein
MLKTYIGADTETLMLEPWLGEPFPHERQRARSERPIEVLRLPSE